jgi:hypothetical protein
MNRRYQVKKGVAGTFVRARVNHCFIIVVFSVHVRVNLGLPIAGSSMRAFLDACKNEPSELELNSNAL